MARLSPRILSFVLLATVLATANTYGSTLAAALFLNRAGADAIPVYYVVYAVISIPISIAFTRLIDRWSRAALFTTFLGGGAAVMVLAAAAAHTESLALIYGLYIVISVFEQTSYSIFYVLVADYFTSVETNRSTTALAVGMALGGLFGGALAGLGAEGFSPATLLFGMPALLAATLGAFIVLRRRTKPLGEPGPQEDESLRESFAAFAPLVARYPIVALISAGVFLNIVVQSVIEYQVFVIYAERFPDEQDLTSFLGILNGALNVLNILTSTLITGPLLNRLGVARMNIVYPVMAVSAFGALGASFTLPSAVYGHVVYDPWAHSVDAPIFVSNYNAMPHRFVGKVRIFNDGLVYPFAMAVTGGALWLVQDHVAQGMVTWVGFGLALAFLACGVAIRYAYPKALRDMLRAGAMEFGDTTARELQIPQDDIRRLLLSSDPKAQSTGLELAVRSDLGTVLGEIESLLAKRQEAVSALFLTLIDRYPSETSTRALVALTAAEDAGVRALALEALMNAPGALDDMRLADLAADPAPTVAALAVIAILRRQAPSQAQQDSLSRFLAGPERFRIRVLHIVRRTRDPALRPLLMRLRGETSAASLPELLDAAAALGAAAPPEADMWAREALAVTDIARGAARRAACRLLAARQDSFALPVLAQALGDPLQEVRLQAAKAVASFGALALPTLRDSLARGDDLIEAAAIESAGRIGGAEIEDILYAHLQERHFKTLRRNAKRLAMLPPPRANDRWAPLAAALADRNRQAFETTLAVVAALGYRRTLQAMRGIMAGGDARSRANAVETVASIGHRRFVLPLLPLLEGGMDATASRRGHSTADELEKVAENALEDSNRWMRAGAILTGVEFGLTVASDIDPIVQNAIETVSTKDKEAIMSRLIFLKTIPLFEGLSLDDLLSVDEALGNDSYLAGETIVNEGESGAALFILASGKASVRIGAEQKEVAQLGEGEFFGEMALFDDQPRSASIIALADTTLLTLDRDRFSTLVMQRPEVLFHICKMFGARLRETNRLLAAA
ncbi:MAG: MFS transporter [Proteobacteria bacterium]|nr:MFS transporter [Pseudomonadota bacterium]